MTTLVSSFKDAFKKEEALLLLLLMLLYQELLN